MNIYQQLMIMIDIEILLYGISFIMQTIKCISFETIDNFHNWSEGIMGSMEDPNKSWYQGSKYDA